MVKEKIQRINSYVNKVSLDTNKSMIKILILSIILLLPFYFTDCLVRNIKFSNSIWVGFVIIAFILVFYGIYLLYTLKFNRLNYILYIAVCGLYISSEFYSLGISKTINELKININILYFIILIFLNLITVLWIMRYRDDKNKKIQFNFKCISICIISVAYLIVLYMIGRYVFTAIFVLYILGFIELMHLLYFEDYFIARKYKEEIDLFKKDNL